MTLPVRDKRPAAAGATSATARWLNTVTTLVLASAALFVVVSAGPSVLRAALHAGQPQDVPAPPIRVHHPTFVPHDHPLPRSFDRGGSVPMGRAGDGDLAPPSRSRPGVPPPAAAEEEDDGEPGFGLGLRGGVTVRPLLLRDRHSGSVLHEVRAGQAVAILRDDGEWVLVVHKTDDDIVTGWARRSELLLR